MRHWEEKRIAAVRAAVVTHGMANKCPEYRIWKLIKRRCYNQHSKEFRFYGGRGVTVCDEWRKNFAAFLAQIGPRPSSAHSIDRIDNTRGYEPGNVRWATRIQQQRNTSTTRLFTLNGESLTVPEWAERVGIPKAKIWARLYRGWPLALALSTDPPSSSAIAAARANGTT